jgi:hypothetical protein|nr:MAG TPA: hypothetical protein [Caudoviricetes sp.]
MPIDSPLKYSRESFDLIRAVHNNNFRFSPESRMVGLTENTDKSNQPVTKQSVLDVFNTQVIERINYLAKYSKQLWKVDVGDYGNGTDPNTHQLLVGHLGYSDTNNEYGVMAVRNYLTLNDFRDQEGEITYDDAANTFSGAISDLSRLGKVRIVVKKGNTPYSDNTYYAILNTRDENLIDYNTIRNSIVSSGNFNSICKSWANKIIDRANNVSVYYEYKLPDPPPPAEGGVKFLRKEAYFESVNLDGDGRWGKNSVSYGAIFGEGDTTAYFEIPKVTRNLKGVKIHISTSARLSNDGRYGLTVYNKNSGVILGHIPWTPGTGIRTFYFNNPISLSRDRSYDNLILMLNTKVRGDRGDAMGMIATIEELIFDDNIRISHVPIYANASRINQELIGPIFDSTGNFLKITYKYTLRDCYAKPSVIRSTFSRSHDNKHHFVERIEQWRDGVRIGISKNPTYTDEVQSRFRLSDKSRFKGNRHNTLITMKHDVSNLDFKNGDELRFIYGYLWHQSTWGTGGIHEIGNGVSDLQVFERERLQIWIDSVLCKEEPISQ